MRHPNDVGWRGAAMLVAILAAAVWVAKRSARPPRHCPDGMVALDWRCCGEGQRLENGHCLGAPSRCSSSQIASAEGCVPRRARVALSGGEVARPPTDWDAPAPRPAFAVAPFAIDSHEVTEADYRECVEAKACFGAGARGEPGLPQTDVNIGDARAYCRWSGGALPTPEQYAFAAMGVAGRRYPWGDAGAVCRRVAYGLADGPCAHGGDGPQIAGSQPDGATPEGIHDLAGNVAEWVEGGSVRGGSWRDAGPTALRSFSAVALAPEERRRDVGFRCVYPAAAP